MNRNFPKGASGLWHRAMHYVDHRGLISEAGASLEVPPLSWQGRGMELLLVFRAVLIYRLRGNRSDVCQSLDQLMRHSITRVHSEVTDLDLPGQAAKMHICELRFDP